MELILEVVLQFVLELFGELLVDGAFRRTASDRRWRRFFLYALLGAALGLLSLFAFPRHLLGDPLLRGLALVFNPLVIGWLMMRLGRWRKKRADTAYGLEAFWPAWAFALCFGLMRTLFAG